MIYRTFLIEEFICRRYVVKAGFELLILVPLPPTRWGYRHVPAHLAHPLVLKALCIENKSNNQIFRTWPAKMILSLTHPHCTVYNRSGSSYWYLVTESLVSVGFRWHQGGCVRNFIMQQKRHHKHPCGVVFPIDSTIIYNTIYRISGQRGQCLNRQTAKFLKSGNLSLP